jgi:hypothetical protein
MRYSQSGAALILFLTIMVLGISALLLSELNTNTDLMLEKQAQTTKVLSEAKETLLAFAGTYAEMREHLGQPQGYLPCPDYDGDGSADASCGTKGHSVIGFFPWRTLGLPPLRDGSGECLWYAISGNYKDQPKTLLTNQTEGLFLVKNSNNDIIAENALAILFAPGKTIGEQNRTITDNTVCGENATANHYLDELNAISNASGDKDTTDNTNDNILKSRPSKSANFWITNKPEDTPTFISAPLTYDSYIDDGKEHPDTGKVIFNDTLMLITPKDFESVYERMNYWVAKQVARCLEAYGNQYVRNIVETASIDEYSLNFDETNSFQTQLDEFLDTNNDILIIQCKQKCGDPTCQTECEDEEQYRKQTIIKAYKEEYAVQIQNHANTMVNNCKAQCTDPKTKADCESTCENNLEQYANNAIRATRKYPWAVPLNASPSYDDNSGQRFGRIPEVLDNTVNDNLAVIQNNLYFTWENSDMSETWANSNGKLCFDEDGGLDDYGWEWWSEWKEEVFFAIDENNTPTADTYLWIAGALETTLCTLSQIRTDVFKCPSHTAVPDNTLTLNNNPVKKVILVAGRKLLLNPESSVSDYPKYQQIRDTNEDKQQIKNYLEGKQHSTNPELRKLTEWNIPDQGEADTIPTGDEHFYGHRSLSNFNDAVCTNSRSCPY